MPDTEEKNIEKITSKFWQYPQKFVLLLVTSTSQISKNWHLHVDKRGQIALGHVLDIN